VCSETEDDLVAHLPVTAVAQPLVTAGCTAAV